MRITRIPKKRGSFRTICVPSEEEKKALRALLPELHKLQVSLCGPEVHGFFHARSSVTNALRHVNKAYTLCFDLKDFFDTVTRDAATAAFSDFRLDKWNICFVNGIAMQGLPTSPMIANIAARLLDSMILTVLLRVPGAVYTRYADDLTISYDQAEYTDTIKEIITESVTGAGFELAAHKTCLYEAKAGYRKVTGISVGPEGIRPTRESRRKLRAALHQNNTESARGLTEWCLLKPPLATVDRFAKFCAFYGLPQRRVSAKTIMPNPALRSNMDIVYSSDPVTMMCVATLQYGVPKALRPENKMRTLYNWAISPNVCLAGRGSRSAPPIVLGSALDIASHTVTFIVDTPEDGMVALPSSCRGYNARHIRYGLDSLGIRTALTTKEIVHLESRGHTNRLKEVNVTIKRVLGATYAPPGVTITSNKNGTSNVRFFIERPVG